MLYGYISWGDVEICGLGRLAFCSPKYELMLGSSQVINESGADCIKGRIHGYCLIKAPLELPAIEA